MPEVNKAALVTQFNDITGNQAVMGSFQKVGNIVSPTYEISPKYATFVKSASATVSGTSVVQPDVTKDFYLTSVSASYVKDAACDSATGAYSIGMTYSGAYQYVMHLPITTLTAQSGSVFLSFPYPIKLDRGGSIAITGTFAAGTCTRYLGVTGFYL